MTAHSGTPSTDSPSTRPAKTGVLERVSTGDTHAMDQLVAQFGGLVWSLARKLSPTEADAEDAVQEIFLSVWQSAARYDGTIASEATYIAMIARRRLIDRQRRQGRRREKPSEFADDAATDTRTDAVVPLPLREEADQAAKAMENLTENQQQVLRLSIYEGLSHERISHATGMPLGTVKTHARRGLIKLRNLLSVNLNAETSENPQAATTTSG